MKLILLLLPCLPALAAEVPDTTPNHPGTTADRLLLGNQYFQDHGEGRRYDWTLYGHDYSQPNYGHHFVWSKPDLGRMSLCYEVDGETLGLRYSRRVEDQYCPTFEAAYRWDSILEGQPSRCLKTDKETEGKRFGRYVADSFCVKPATVFTWRRREGDGKLLCDEVDASTRGKVYRRDARGGDYLCAHTVNVDVAFGHPKPSLPVSRAPASKVSAGPSGDIDPAFQEDLKLDGN